MNWIGHYYGDGKSENGVSLEVFRVGCPSSLYASDGRHKPTKTYAYQTRTDEISRRRYASHPRSKGRGRECYTHLDETRLARLLTRDNGSCAVEYAQKVTEKRSQHD